MDINRLMAEAVARHGVKLDANDPAVVIVTLNRLMLEEAVRGVADEVRRAAKEFDAAGERMQKGVGVAVAREVARAGNGLAGPSRGLRWRWVGMAFLMGFVAGRLV